MIPVSLDISMMILIRFYKLVNLLLTVNDISNKVLSLNSLQAQASILMHVILYRQVLLVIAGTNIISMLK